MAQTYRTKFYKLKAFRDRFKVASSGAGPFVKIGSASYVSGTAGQVTSLSDINTQVFYEPMKYHWPR